MPDSRFQLWLVDTHGPGRIGDDFDVIAFPGFDADACAVTLAGIDNDDVGAELTEQLGDAFARAFKRNGPNYTHQAGDGTRFKTRSDALAYCESVARRTNVVLGCERLPNTVGSHHGGCAK